MSKLVPFGPAAIDSNYLLPKAEALLGNSPALGQQVIAILAETEVRSDRKSLVAFWRMPQIVPQ